MDVRAFLRAKLRSLEGRGRQLARLDHQSVGIRPQDLPYAPSPRQFAAVNERLAAIDERLAARLADLRTKNNRPRPRAGADGDRDGRARNRPRAPQLGPLFRGVQPARQLVRADPRRARRHRRRLLFRGHLGGLAALSRPAAPAPHLYGTRLLAGDLAAWRPAQPIARRDQPVSADPHPVGSR